MRNIHLSIHACRRLITFMLLMLAGYGEATHGQSRSSPINLEAPLTPLDDATYTPWEGAVDCFSPSQRRPDIVELSLAAADNRFGKIDQSVGQVSGAWDHCVTRRSRIHTEAIYARVNEQGRRSSAVLFGIGYRRAIFSNLTLSPTVRWGREHLANGRSQRVLNADLSINLAVPLDRLDGTVATFALRPEWTDRRVSSVDTPNQGRSSGNFTQNSAAALDMSLASRLRGKVEFSHQYFSGGSAISSVGSLSLSTRFLTRDRRSYIVNAELRGSHGDHGYESLLFSLSFRFGSPSKWKGIGL